MLLLAFVLLALAVLAGPKRLGESAKKRKREKR